MDQTGTYAVIACDVESQAKVLIDIQRIANIWLGALSV